MRIARVLSALVAIGASGALLVESHRPRRRSPGQNLGHEVGRILVEQLGPRWNGRVHAAPGLREGRQRDGQEGLDHRRANARRWRCRQGTYTIYSTFKYRAGPYTAYTTTAVIRRQRAQAGGALITGTPGPSTMHRSATTTTSTTRRRSPSPLFAADDDSYYEAQQAGYSWDGWYHRQLGHDPTRFVRHDRSHLRALQGRRGARGLPAYRYGTTKVAYRYRTHTVTKVVAPR
jgi:hypothetical protein